MKKLYLTSPEEWGPGPDSIHFLELSKCRSTNDHILKNIDSFSSFIPLLVESKEQSAGRGRDGRKWISSGKDGLYISFLLRIDKTKHLQFISIAAGTAVAEAILSVSGIKVDIKWPNDIEISGLKAGGILIENRIFRDEIISITGIGLNVNAVPDTTPDNFSINAVSLLSAAGKPLDKADLRNRISEYFIHFIEKLEKNGSDSLLERYLYFLKHSFGERIGFHNKGETVNGIYKGIDRMGGIMIKPDQGEEKTFYSGEIT